MRTYPDLIRATPGLAAYWPLDDPIGAGSALDASGNGRHLTRSSGTFGLPGPITDSPGRAMAAPNLTNPQGHLAGLTTLSCEWWVYLPTGQWPTNGANTFGGTFTPGVGAWSGWRFVNFNSTTNLGFQAFSTNGAFPGITITGPWKVGWNHIIATLDGTAVRGYLNGALAASFTLTNPANPSTVAPTLNFSGATWNSYLFAHCAIYDRALTASEAAQHYRAGTQPDLTAPAITVVGSRSPSRLTLVVTRADGTRRQLSPDNGDPGRVPSQIKFSTSIPGGFKTLSCKLARQPSEEFLDLDLADTIQAVLPGGEIAWEGRISGIPRTDNDLTLEAQGWSSHLRDDDTATALIVDRDLSHWGPASRARREHVLAGYSIVDAQQRADETNGKPTLALEVTGAWAAGAIALCEAIYDAGPTDRIGSIYYAWRKNAGISGTPPWTWALYADNSDVFAAPPAGTGNLVAAGPATGTFNITGGRRFGLAQLFYGGAPAGTQGYKYTLDFTCLAVYGTHGLTPRGTGTDTAAPGFLASDVIPHLIARFAPHLTIGLIEPTQFIIPHLAWREPTTVEQMITETNRFDWQEWAVWEHKTFEMRRPDADRLTWQARQSDGAQLRLEGTDLDQTVTGVVVSYTPPEGGTKRTVGPPGSRCQFTDARLADQDPSNPAARALLNKPMKLDLSEPTTDAGAVQIGSMYLRDRLTPARRGQMTLTGMVRHPTRGMVPVSTVRSGDYIHVTDHSSDIPRRIVDTDYDHDTRTLTASLDNRVFSADSLLERIGVLVLGQA